VWGKTELVGINLGTFKTIKNKDKSSKKCPECISEIPIQAKRCSYCAQIVVIS
jgi:hypothetical protein